MSSTPQHPVRPPDRYGEDSPAWHRTVARSAVIVLAVIGVAWVAWSGIWQGHRPTGTVVTWTVVDSSRMKASLDVTMPARRSGVCTLQAKDNHQNLVGQTVVKVPKSQAGTQRIDAVINTQGRGASVVLESCADD